MRIRMIRVYGVFVWYARSYDTRRIRMIHAFVDDTRIPVFNWLIMICVMIAYDTSIILVSYVKIYASDTLLFEIFLIFAWEMSTMRTNLMVTCSAQNAGNRISGLQISKIFRGGMPPDSPRYAMSLKMLRSDFWLDPPLYSPEYITPTQKKNINLQFSHYFLSVWELDYLCLRVWWSTAHLVCKKVVVLSSL